MNLPDPPWGQRQSDEEAGTIHPRWAHQLRQRLPEGVPATAIAEDWPVTFGYVVGRKARHTVDDDGDCLQCGGCRYYVPIAISDWGACTNEESEYDRVCVFEHWTCAAFAR